MDDDSGYWTRRDDLCRSAGFTSAWGKIVSRFTVAQWFSEGTSIRIWEIPVEVLDLACTFERLKTLLRKKKRRQKKAITK